MSTFETVAPATSPRPSPVGSARLVSLDAFRGLTMFLMVLVNNAGSSPSYAQLEHSDWNGLTLADVIFPSFLWIVGITTILSLGSRLGNASKTDLLKQVFFRAIKMYVIGLCLYAAPRFDLSTQRILGVLQRIAICYFAGALLYLYTSRRTQIACIAALIAGYWALMTLVPAPGFHPGDLSMQGNLAHYVDRLVLGSHNYASTKTWDPEGVLSTLPAIATMLLGMMAGYELQRPSTLRRRLTHLALAGSVLLAAGLIANHWFPVNKKLWSPSFVLVTAGIDCLLLPVFAWITDIKGQRQLLKPFVILGMNAISIYVLSEVLAEALDMLSWQQPIFHACFHPLASPQMASFLYACAYTLVMYAAAYVLYRRQIFIRL